MLKNYLVVALRTLWRQKGYAALNVTGLGVGLASVLLIAAYVRFEGSFDRFHRDADRLYRVDAQQPGNEFLGSDRYAVQPAGLGRALVERVPDVEAAATFSEAHNLIAHPTDAARRFAEEGYWADEAFLDLFTFPLLAGEARTALREPGSVVLTASLAERLFGTTDAVGRTLDVYSPFGPPEPQPHRVTAVAADPPGASHLAFTFLLSIHGNTGYVEGLEQWGNSGWYTYLRTRPGADPARVGAAMTALYRGLRTERTTDRLYLTPLPAVHLDAATNFGPGTPGDARMVGLFTVIAVVILLLACVNYTNLATARSVRRAREVGLRKTVGARRSDLVLQHLCESVLTALLALGVALGLAHAALPAFAAWTDRALDPSLLTGAAQLPLLVLFAVGVGVVAGAYPAFVLTAPSPALVLKGHARTPGGARRLRALLVVGQYAAAVVLVVGSLVVYRQMQYVRSQTTGLGREGIVTIEAHTLSAQDRLPAFAEAVAALPGVAGVTTTSHLPTDVASSNDVRAWEGHPEVEGEGVQMYVLLADAAFSTVYPAPLVAGRMFSPAFPSDTSGALVLNETAVRALGWTPEEAVGRTVNFWDTDSPVVGVVRDFHLHSLHQPIAPLLMRYDPGRTSHVSLRLDGARAAETLAAVEGVWAGFTNYPFAYAPLSERVATLYVDDERLARGVGGFTLLALFIASLGLFGLAASAAEQRTKEIGVRKVLGAGVAGLVGRLTWDFLRLVAVALVVAVPVAALAADRWLEGFAYRIPLGPTEFLLAGGLALLVGALTVSTQALRAATADPVQSLRSE